LYHRQFILNFLPRDAMRKRGKSRRPVSVCLYHSHVLYTNS